MKKIIFLVLMWLLNYKNVSAGGHLTGPTPSAGGVTPWGPGSFTAVISALLDAIVAIGTLAIAIMIVWSGFLFVTSGGDTTKLTKARQSFFWTLIGAAIILGARAIELAIRDTIPTI